MSDGFSSRHHLMDKENLFTLPHQDEDYATGLTRRFSRSLSLQHPLFSFKENPVFSGSPETTTGWPGHSPAPIKSDEDAWNLIYTAAGQAMNSHGGVTGGSPWRRSDGEELFRQQHFGRSRCVAAWPPPRHQQNHGGATAAKRGTGVFLPRRYCTSNPPESRKRQGCPPGNYLPARVIQSSIAPPQIQSQINSCFVSHYEMLMSRRKAMISSVQRRQSDIHGGVMEAPVNNPEMLLPQEWTY